MQKLIIEARVNEYMMRSENPNVPWTPDEIAEAAAECRAEGATIAHFHGRADDGAPDHDAARYEDTVRKIKEKSDILVHPTLGFVTLDASAEERLSNVMKMAEDPATRPDFAPMDTGSVNVDWYDPKARKFDTKGLIYRNGTDTLEYFAKNIQAAGLKQYLVSWNISFTRQAVALMDMGLIPQPAYMCFCLTDGIMLAGHPGTPEGLDAHTAFLPKDKQIEWTVCNFNGDLLLLTEKIIKEGGHISIGLGDYPYAEYGSPKNAELVRKVREQSLALGREVATLEETRDILGMN